MDIRLDDTTGYLQIVNGDLVITTGSDATRQRVLQALRAYSGEWFLDLSDGIDFFGSIFVKNPNVDLIENLLKTAILSVYGVIELTYFTLDYTAASRSMSLVFGVRTDEENIDFSIILGA